MKRSSFLKTAIAAGVAIVTPITLFAKRIYDPGTGKGFLVPAGKDRNNKSISLFEGDVFYNKVTTEDSDGNMYVVETTRDKKGGPPLHIHPEQDEWWYVMEGEFRIKVGDQVFNAKPGDSVFGPRKVPHAMEKVNDGPAKLMIMYQPAGKMEAYFKAISEGATKNFTEEQFKAFRTAHGLELVGPALGHLKQGI